MKKLFLVTLGLLVICVIFLIQQTNSLKTTQFTWESPRVPRGFDGFCIALVSDLHNKRFGKNQARLVRAVRDLEPDLIALTGDFIDMYTKDLDFAREFFEGVSDIAPMYWVDGNHDPPSPFYEELLELLSQYDVTILNGYTQIERDGDEMTLAGFSFWDLDDISQPADIVLYHNPDTFGRFASHGYGLVLAGHNHGGQIALPGGKAILSPGGGLFPAYSGGMYTEGGAAMVLSRGLGTVYVPVRAFARPEVVGVTLRGGLTCEIQALDGRQAHSGGSSERLGVSAQASYSQCSLEHACVAAGGCGGDCFSVCHAFWARICELRDG